MTSPRKIFINLPVADVAASIAFYEAIGFTKNPQFSNDTGACMVWSDDIYVMLAAQDFFRTFTPKPLADTQTTSAALFALAFDSRGEVDSITEAAVAAGGKEGHDPEDLGFMYSRAFWDLDGHGFGPFWMDPAAAANGPPADAEVAD